MSTTRLLSVVTAACLVAIAASCLTGCGGDADTGQGTPTTGSITGRTVDARTSLGLGNVRVAVGTTSGAVFTEAGATLSSAPTGDWTIAGLQPGTYNTLRVTPAESLFGAQPDKLATFPVVAGGNLVLDPILITDGTPPTPASN